MKRLDTCRVCTKRWMMFLAGCFLVAMAWWGCSPEKDYELLSFFFDGVPDPNAPLFDDSGAVIVAGPMASVHPPFAEERCRDCHTNPADMFLTRDDASLCLTCHADVPDQNPVVHGAVAGMACLWCHDPHHSRFESLLRRPAPELCQQCHVQELMGAPGKSAHVSENTNCLECHYGHGGESDYFLRNLETGENDASDDGVPDEDNSSDAS